MSNILQVDEFIHFLRQNINDVDFFYAFPDKEFPTPLNNGYVCSVLATVRNISDNHIKQQTISYELELVAPLKATGKNLFEKSQEICHMIVNTEIANNIHCSTGDIVYVKLKRCYSLKIKVEISDESFQKCAIALTDNVITGVLTSLKVQCHSCDIMVYGMSKPFDTLLENRTYTLELQTDCQLPETVGFCISYDTKADTTVRYSKCKVNDYSLKHTNGITIYTYNITAYERSELPL